MPRTKKVADTALRAVKIPMTDAQMRKLAKGQGVRINPKSGCTAYDVWCTGDKCRRMERMMTKGKGFTLKLSPEEMDENIEMEGGRINWKKIGKTLRSTAAAVGKFYREKIRPTVGPKIKEAVKKAIEEGIPLAGEYLGAVTGQPEIVAAAKSGPVRRFAKKTAEKGTEKIGKLTGAFGMSGAKPPKTKKSRAKAKPKMSKMPSAMPMEMEGGALKVDKSMTKQISAMQHPKIIPYRAQLQDNYSPFLNPNHPGMHPTLPMPDNSLPLVGRGLYMTRGGGLFAATSGGAMGMPMDPSLPPIDNSTYYF